MQEQNIELSALGTGQAWGEDGLSFTHENKDMRKEAIKRVKSHIVFASKTAAIVIIGLLQGVLQGSASVAFSLAQEWMYECFSECCNEAVKYNVCIAFKSINRYETSFINTIEEGGESH